MILTSFIGAGEITIHDLFTLMYMYFLWDVFKFFNTQNINHTINRNDDKALERAEEFTDTVNELRATIARVNLEYLTPEKN